MQPMVTKGPAPDSSRDRRDAMHHRSSKIVEVVVRDEIAQEVVVEDEILPWSRRLGVTAVEITQEVVVRGRLLQIERPAGVPAIVVLHEEPLQLARVGRHPAVVAIPMRLRRRRAVVRHHGVRRALSPAVATITRTRIQTETALLIGHGGQQALAVAAAELGEVHVQQVELEPVHKTQVEVEII
uniref:Uncharacterized protein n=1 Tax=Triticum urartu TaxID=4572 RepID=A0A8R7PJB4_TRIUA